MYDYLKMYARTQAANLSAHAVKRQNIIKIECEKLTKTKDNAVLTFIFKGQTCKELRFTILAYTSDDKELKTLVHLIGVNMDQLEK